MGLWLLLASNGGTRTAPGAFDFVAGSPVFFLALTAAIPSCAAAATPGGSGAGAALDATPHRLRGVGRICGRPSGREPA